MAAAHDTAPGRRTRRKDARPGELIAAALEVFAKHGFAAARLDDIAARAGVTKGTIYLYFEDKTELFEAVVRDTLVRFLAQGRATVRDFEGSSPELLRRVLRVWWDGIVLTPASALPKLVISEAVNFPELARFYHANVIEPGRQLLAQVIARGVADGSFRRVDPSQFVHFVVGPMLYAQLNEHSFARVLPAASLLDAEFVDAFIDTVLHALAPGAGADA